MSHPKFDDILDRNLRAWNRWTTCMRIYYDAYDDSEDAKRRVTEYMLQFTDDDRRRIQFVATVVQTQGYANAKRSFLSGVEFEEDKQPTSFLDTIAEEIGLEEAEKEGYAN